MLYCGGARHTRYVRHRAHACARVSAPSATISSLARRSASVTRFLKVIYLIRVMFFMPNEGATAHI